MHSDSRVKVPVCLATTSLPDPCLSTYLSPRFREEPFKTLTLGPLEAQTQYLGAVILGGDPGTPWRQRLRVQATGHDYQILLAWASQTLQLVQDEEE